MIVQNKDEIAVPLELAAIPTPKEFREAVESLSPEQRRFAQAIASSAASCHHYTRTALLHLSIPCISQ